MTTSIEECRAVDQAPALAELVGRERPLVIRGLTPELAAVLREKIKRYL